VEGFGGVLFHGGKVVSGRKTSGTGIGVQAAGI